jgi:two-component system NtrC family sensor kinase
MAFARSASCVMTRETTNRTPSVLLVDDQPGVARPIGQLLRRRGLDVVVADSGAAAIVELHHQWFDGLLIDFHMPDIRGDALYARAIAIQPHLAQRTIFLTGDVSDVARDALTSTGSAVVSKPFEIAELERIVRSVILDKMERQR